MTGSYLIVEHVENAGAVRKWIQEGNSHALSEFLEREAGDHVRFLDSLARAVAEGQLTADVARAACPDPHAFDRIRSGIRSGTR